MTKIMQTLFLVHGYVKLYLQPVRIDFPLFTSNFDQHVAWCRVHNQKGNRAISLSQKFKDIFNCYVQLLQPFWPPRKYQLVATLPAADTGLFIVDRITEVMAVIHQWNYVVQRQPILTETICNTEVMKIPSEKLPVIAFHFWKDKLLSKLVLLLKITSNFCHFTLKNSCLVLIK